MFEKKCNINENVENTQNEKYHSIIKDAKQNYIYISTILFLDFIEFDSNYFFHFHFEQRFSINSLKIFYI